MVKKINTFMNQQPALFGGKKAAPFVSGGGRNQNHPRTAKGTPRKRKGRRHA
jgi:hypothetical protein